MDSCEVAVRTEDSLKATRDKDAPASANNLKEASPHNTHTESNQIGASVSVVTIPQTECHSANFQTIDLDSPYDSQITVPKADENQHGLMTLPPEIRNMIYRFALVEPHRGYLKCHYNRRIHHGKKLYRLANIRLRSFQLNKQVWEEASSLFYAENVFVIADQQRFLRKILDDAKEERILIDVSRIQKLHITNRECKWLSNPSRTSSLMYRDTFKHHIAVFAHEVKMISSSTTLQLQYLLIDCFSGFGMPARGIMNLFKPLQDLNFPKLKKVHIVSSDEDHLPYLQLLEKKMTNHPSTTGEPITLSHDSPSDRADHAKDPHRWKAGNELAKILSTQPCYPLLKLTGMSSASWIPQTTESQEPAKDGWLKLFEFEELTNFLTLLEA